MEVILESLADLVGRRDVDGIKRYMTEHNLVLDGDRLVPADDSARQAAVRQAQFWDQRQQAR